MKLTSQNNRRQRPRRLSVMIAAATILATLFAACGSSQPTAPVNNAGDARATADAIVASARATAAAISAGNVQPT